MLSGLVVAVVMMAFDGGVLNGAVHPLDLTVGPGMIGFCEPMLDAVCLSAVNTEGTDLRL